MAMVAPIATITTIPIGYQHRKTKRGREKREQKRKNKIKK
jgi:hypothetical protein